MRELFYCYMDCDMITDLIIDIYWWLYWDQMLRGLSLFYPYTYGRDLDEICKWLDQLLNNPNADIWDLHLFWMRLQITELVSVMLLVLFHVNENYWKSIVRQ